jgi:hypothetical protein
MGVPGTCIVKELSPAKTKNRVCMKFDGVVGVWLKLGCK